MQRIQPSANVHHWPRHAVASVECRKRDLVVRVADWTRDRDEPAYDVEVYIGGVYDWNESQCFSVERHGGKRNAKRAATEYAGAQIAKLL